MVKLARYRLGDLIDVSRGQSLSGDNYSEHGEYIRLTLANFDYQNGGFKVDTQKKDIYYTGTIKSHCLLQEGDIITPLTEQTPGLLGSTARIPESGKYIQSGDIAIVKCKEGLIDPSFCYYLLPSKQVKSQLAVGSQQTKIRHTSPDAIMACVVDIPPLEEQKKIGEFLDTITNKVMCNRQQNEQIEKLASLLYNYWFVQFDFPNESGKPYKTSGGSMVYNNLLKRDIPEGWEVKTLNCFACYSEDQESNNKKGIYVSTDNMLPNKMGIIPSSVFPSYGTCTAFTPNDILISNIRPYLKKIWLADREGACSNDVLCVKSLSEEMGNLIYMSLWQDAFFDYSMQGSKGTKMPRGDKDHIMSFPIIFPNILCSLSSSQPTSYSSIIQACR